MCGIAGIVDLRLDANALREQALRMTAVLRHRGPDGGGLWSGQNGGVALGHRRLAVIDLTEDGHQPMVSRSGRLVITYNGEVYNYRALRGELEALGRVFRGHSDTEVMLEAIEEWGLEGALGRFTGMFAFALWDNSLRQLSLVRDRLGKKPLYYSLAGGRLLFGSELKALKAAPGFDDTLDRDALARYFRFNYVPAPFSIYRGTLKLEAGSILRVDCAGPVPTAGAPVRYWDPRTVFEQAEHAPFTGSEDEASARADELLRDAVRLRLVSDVPVGAFLSGGVDSSAVVALMQGLSSRPVRTFTIGNREDSYDEAGYAAAVARHLGTDHTELYVEPAAALQVIPELPGIYDEPFADSSQIPTLLVSRLARQSVTVGLSGDGGDEVFVGYSRYVLGERVARLARNSFGGATLLNALARRVPPRHWMRLLDGLRWALPGRYSRTAADDRLRTFSRMLGSRWPWGFYEALTRHWDETAGLVLGTREPAYEAGTADWSSLVREMVIADQRGYLADDILVKVDRASMAASLEARAPLLDHRLIEFMATVPTRMSVRDGIGKRLLRRSLYRHVPRALIDRPKSGFGVPIAYWLRNELRDWAEDLLSEQRLSRQGVLDVRRVRSVWQAHLSGARQEHHRLWGVLMFQAWLDHAATVQSADLAAIA
jgi:asparagine synthase (glutamine-hydrolysing)